MAGIFADLVAPLVALLAAVGAIALAFVTGRARGQHEGEARVYAEQREAIIKSHEDRRSVEMAVAGDDDAAVADRLRANRRHPLRRL